MRITELKISVFPFRRISTQLIFMIAVLLVLHGCAPTGQAFVRTPNMLDPQGPSAANTAMLSWVFIALGTIIYLGVMGYLLYALLRRRSAASELPSLDDPDRGSRTVMIWGGGFTGVVLVGLFGLNLAAMAANNRLGESALVVEVTGHTWWWEVNYPNEGFTTANEVRIPAGQPVQVRLSTADVIHSFWIPELSGKLDTIPGKVNTLTLRADQPGEYWGECAEYCGTQHAKMKLLVVALPPEEYQAWVKQQQQAPPSPAEGSLEFEGQQIFLGSACVYCHTIEGTNASSDLGPDLTHLASRRTLGAGILENTPGNLAGWILNAQAIKPGNQMPPMDLNGDELQAILAYLATLK